MTKEKKTAIPNEQQSNVIINKIIKIIADENLTIDEADKILYATTKQIKQQVVKFS